MTEIELDPKLLGTLKTLESHAVEYVLVGEVADAIHDGGGFISAVAIVPASYGRNVDRLASALQALDARLGDGRPMDPYTTNLRATAPCTFRTAYAAVALDFAPGGTNGYADLFDDAARTHLTAGVSPHVASPHDLDRMEQWARATRGAPPDAAHAPPPVEPNYWQADAAPRALSPDPFSWPEDWPDEIRASRATRR